MKVITLGTGSPIPDSERAGPSTLVQVAGLNLLFDCGRGVLMRSNAVFVGTNAFNVVFLTHLHSDHVTDLNDVITMQWAMSFSPTPLRIIGPVGTAKLVERTLAMLEDDIGYRLTHHDDLNWQPTLEVTEVTDGVVFEQDGVRVIAAPTDHRPVHPTVGYRIEAEGRVVALAGDTKPCDGLDLLSADADLYVQTTIRRPAIEAFPLPRLLDILDYHSSIEEAAETATRNRARVLVLTHPVPAPAVGSEAEAEWVSDAAAAGFTGVVIVPRDLQEFDV